MSKEKIEARAIVDWAKKSRGLERGSKTLGDRGHLCMRDNGEFGKFVDFILYRGVLQAHTKSRGFPILQEHSPRERSLATDPGPVGGPVENRDARKQSVDVSRRATRVDDLPVCVEVVNRLSRRGAPNYEVQHVEARVPTSGTSREPDDAATKRRGRILENVRVTT